MGRQLQDFCATDDNDEMSSGRFSVSQSIRIDATFEIFISLPIVFEFKLLFYLSYLSLLHDVFALCTMRLLGRADVPSARLLKR